MFLYDFARVSIAKLVLSVGIITIAAFAPRVRCVDNAATCLSLQFLQFVPALEAQPQATHSAWHILHKASHPVTRLLDASYVFLAACLVMSAGMAWRGRIWRGRAAWLFAGSVVAGVGGYVVQNLLMMVGSPSVLDLPRIHIELATVVRDIGDSVMVATLVTVVWMDHAAVPARLLTLRRILLLTVALVQAGGLLFRYTGITCAPTVTFAVILGAAWVVSPIQFYLVLLTTYVRKPRELARA